MRLAIFFASIRSTLFSKYWNVFLWGYHILGFNIIPGTQNFLGYIIYLQH